jgi:F0F1-type ATP synthase assembly protein I
VSGLVGGVVVGSGLGVVLDDIAMGIGIGLAGGAGAGGVLAAVVHSGDV